MDVFCINTNNPEFQKLLAESGEKQGVFAMTISKWMTKSGIHNRYPTLQELGITAIESAKPGVEELFESNPELASAVYEALGLNNLRKEYSNVIIDQVWKRLASEGITNADSLIGTRETINNKDFNKFWSAVKDVDIQNVISFFKSEKQKALDSYSKYKGEFDPTTGTFTSNNTSFFDNKIKDLNTLLQQKQQAQQLYSQYLDTIFPDSKVKDIVYHGTNSEFDKFQKDKEIYLALDKSISEGYSQKNPNAGKGKVLNILMNIKNPVESVIDDGTYNKYLEEKNKNFDGIIAKGFQNQVLEYIVFEPEQIHILGNKQDIEGFKDFVDKPATSEEIAKESVDVMQKSIQKLEKDGLVDDSRKILKPFDFNAYNEKLTNHARNKYGVTGEGMLFKIVESKSSLPYDRLIGYNKSTFYDVNNELFKELQEKYDAYHSSEGKSGYYQLKDSTNLKQANKELDTYLLDFLKPFGVKSQEVEELKTRLGKDALALTDVLNKVIYHVNSDKLNALSIPEEASHMIVMLMGKHNPLIKELLDNIHKWDKYESIKKLYLPEYQNLAQVKIEAVGQLLSEALVRNNLKPAAKSMFKTIIDNISKWLKEKFSKFQSQLFIADKIAVEVLNGNADFIGNLKPAYPKVDFEKALNGNPLAKKLVTDFATELKLPLVGSLAIAGQNEAIYRSEKEPVHDLDFLQDGRKTSLSRNVAKKLKELNAVEAHKGWPSPDKTYTCFTYFIPAEGYTIIPTNINKNNWVTEFEIHKEGKLFVSLKYYWVKDGKGKLTRTLLTSFENPADSKTDLSQIYMPTDFFFYPKGYSDKTSANNMAHWTSIYNGKMLLSPESRKERMFDRPKDQNDYLLLNPEDRSKKPTEAFMYYQISDEDVIEDLIQEGKLKTKCE